MAKKLVAEVKEEVLPAGKYILRVKSKHPTGKWQLQDNVITRQFKEYDLDEDEAEELGSKGCKAWLEQGSAAQLEADKKIWSKRKSLLAEGTSDKADRQIAEKEAD